MRQINLRSSSTDSIPALAAIALISLLLCLINFSAGLFTRRPQVLAGSRAIFGAQESFVRHLDRAGLHQSNGCPGPNVLPPVSPFVQRLAHPTFRTRADQQSAARSPLDSSRVCQISSESNQIQSVLAGSHSGNTIARQQAQIKRSQNTEVGRTIQLRSQQIEPNSCRNSEQRHQIRRIVLPAP